MIRFCSLNDAVIDCTKDRVIDCINKFSGTFTALSVSQTIVDFFPSFQVNHRFTYVSHTNKSLQELV